MLASGQRTLSLGLIKVSDAIESVCLKPAYDVKLFEACGVQRFHCQEIYT